MTFSTIGAGASARATVPRSANPLDAYALHVTVVAGSGRRDVHVDRVVRFLGTELSMRPGLSPEVARLAVPRPADGDESIASAALHLSDVMSDADALVIVAPEYDARLCAVFERALSTGRDVWAQKAVGVIGVEIESLGGHHISERLLPLLRRHGIMTLFCQVRRPPDDTPVRRGRLDDANGEHLRRFVRNLSWVGETLQHGRGFRRAALADV
jgi:NAD(P)H-dependent FMN reductase